MSKQIEIAELKKEFITLNRFEANVEIQLTGADYDAQIEQIWQNRKDAEAKQQAEVLQAAAKVAAQAKLAALGLTVEDLQALGL